ncbi:MAG: SUMF1/EgtB/PvdO family nonheme iron enzyme [Thermoguttaceae bacterium]|nr:SUMF1/EgtB/PvdO family nonheme iron enzyme [Thermoguttaceae bacterium]
MTEKSPQSPTSENAPNAAETQVAWDASPAPGTRKSFIFNGVEFAFRYCPPGTFLMGGGEAENALTFIPRREVTLTRGFWTLENPVTQGQYEAVVGANPSWFSAATEVRPKDGTPGKAALRYLDETGGDSSRLPVESVTWEDAQDFCKALNDAISLPPGWAFRLPTSAEWERACRAGTTTRFYWGDEFDGSKANCEGILPLRWAISKKIWNRPTEVGQFGANAWGLVDMSGNVEEWTLDRDGALDDPESLSPPTVDPKGAKTGFCRVTRGGSWYSTSDDLRSGSRRFNDQRAADVELGFRCVVGGWDAETAAVVSEPWDEAAEAAVVAAIRTAQENAPPLPDVGSNSDAPWEEAPAAGTRKSFILNGVEFAFRYCPTGTFVEGLASERGYNLPGDRRLTTISQGFWVAETPTTQAQFDAVNADSERSPTPTPTPTRTQSKTRSRKRDSLPVSNATWAAAVAYCESLNALKIAPEGFAFRLLTSAEWEYAARAWTVGPFVDARFLEPTPGEKATSSKPRPVRQENPNAWGLFDMLGNVWEWTADAFVPRDSAPVVDPRRPETASNFDRRIVRGGAYVVRDVAQRSPTLLEAVSENGGVAGFRIALAPRIELTSPKLAARERLRRRLAEARRRAALETSRPNATSPSSPNSPKSPQTPPAPMSQAPQTPPLPTPETLAVAEFDGTWGANPEAGARKTLEIDGIEFAFRFCPPGAFTAGSPATEKGRLPNETQREVVLTQGFWLAETPTTRRQFQATNPTAKPIRTKADVPFSGASWFAAVEFCEKLNALKVAPPGFAFRLPTSDEWEFACRAGTTGPLNVDGAKLAELAWFCGNSQVGKYPEPQPVRQKRPNALGLFDMLGNVEEWTSDLAPALPPADNPAPDNDLTRTKRIRRGGSYLSDARFCRSSLILPTPPDEALATVGFRIALASLDAASPSENANLNDLEK